MRLRAAVLTVLVGAALAVPATPAAAAACRQDSGVTVLVEFASLGGGTQTRCAAGDPSSGLAALRGAGFTPTRAAQEPGYFLCRIDGKPANDPCQRTSPADAYWSYWHAKPGGRWTYSSIGPADYDPAPGTVEGWAFGAGKPPSSPPPRPTPSSPSPAAATQAPAAAAASPAPSAAAPRSTTAAPQSTTPVTTPTLPLPVTPTPATSASPAAAVADPPHDPNSVDKTFTSRSYAISWSALIGVLLVLLLVAATARQVVRRRRESGG